MNYYVTTMSSEYFNALGYKTLQSWLKNCNDGEIILFSENFKPVWDQPHQIVNWSDSFYDKLKIIDLSLSDKWSSLQNILTGRAKNFIWKAAAWEYSVKNLKGVVTFFDADLICFKDPFPLINDFVINKHDISYMSVNDVRPHADSCFYSINTNSEKSKLILDTYMFEYHENTKNTNIYPKPYDAPVLARTIDILKNELSIWNFNEGSTAKSPLKDTILTTYFRHLKGNQKDSGRLMNLIDKTMNAIDKNKTIEEVLLRFDRKLRQDDSKKLGVPF